MTKRILRTAIWSYGAWTAAAGVAWLAGVSEAVGPIAGIAAAAAYLIGTDHRTRVASPTT